MVSGYELQETMGRNCRFLQGPESNIDAVRQLSKAVKDLQEVHVILLNYRKDGSKFWNLLHMNPIVGEDGTLHSIIGAQLDITNIVTNP